MGEIRQEGSGWAVYAAGKCYGRYRSKGRAEQRLAQVQESAGRRVHQAAKAGADSPTHDWYQKKA